MYKSKGLHTFLLSFFIMFLWSKNDNDLKIKEDSLGIKVVSFQKDLPKIYSSSDFDYESNKASDTNIINSVLRKIFGWISDVFGFTPDINYKYLEYGIYGILAVLALYLLIRFLLESPVTDVFKKEDSKIDGFNFKEETIDQIDFEDLIQKALKNNDYRLAIRYLYLKSLQVLAQKSIIDWHYKKTNIDYLNEINNSTVKKSFQKVSYVYDYVWYGEFEIDEELFQKTQTEFSTLNNAVRNG